MHRRKHATGTLVTSALAAIGLLLCAGAGPQANAPSSKADPGISGYTKPSKYAQRIGFTMPGIVKKVHVTPGQTVTTDTVLLELDPAEELKELEFLKIEAESDLPILAAEKNADVKKAEFARIEQAFKSGAATEAEYQKATHERELAALQIDKAKQDKKQAQAKFERQQLRVARLSLKPEFAGIVEKIDITEGDIVDPQKPVMTLVKNDPLWVEVHLATADAARLKDGDTLNVRYPGEAPGTGRGGKLIYKAPQADAASDTQMIRLEMPNTEAKASGLRVLVDLPPAQPKN